jgi:hypothetical protein
MSAFTLLPVLLLSPPAVAVGEIATRRILIAAVALPVVALIASPVIAILVQRAGPPPASAQARLLAAEIERLWRAATPQPLRFIGGDTEVAYAVSAYALDAPRALPGLPPPRQTELAQSGVAFVCLADDAQCKSAVAASVSAIGSSRAIETTITRNFLGYPGRPQRYAITLVPPQS